MSTKKPRVLLVGRHYIIEPLGLIYLAGVAKKLGYEIAIHLVKDADFSSLFEVIAEFKPDIVGFTIWTGYHTKTFPACDRVRNEGIPVVIGGPHATYFTQECAKHADYVVKGEGFRMFRKILAREIGPGVHFDTERVAEGFPTPEREVLYRAYPELGNSPIKSVMGSVGCPYTCSYCYAPTYNQMYDGFELKVRPVDDIIREGLEIKNRWPTEMIYFQDDVFGFSMKWLTEFTARWPNEVGLPWHCQIRLELTREEKRLDLFKKGGCTGITLAIESGNDFLREFVLCRHMSDELIIKGTRGIMDRGLTLRTEQILAVPFSDVDTDLATLELNCRINPQMAWTSILAPYGGTAMGTIASNLGFYHGNNDDLRESFFERSVLQHSKNGREVLEPIVREKSVRVGDNPLLRMNAQGDHNLRKSVFLEKKALGEIVFNNRDENETYANQTVILQRLFNWLSKVPQGEKLGKRITENPTLTWEELGKLTRKHLITCGYESKLESWSDKLKDGLGVRELPKAVGQNPAYFALLPGSADLAKKIVSLSLLEDSKNEGFFDTLGMITRRHLFMKSLYKIESTTMAIASY